MFVSAGMFEATSDLLAEPDPGETPFLIEGLLVRGAIGALVGPYKVGKTWAVLDLAMGVASGDPVMGRFAVERGPVMLVLEESGRSAYHRRIDKLARGRAVAPHRLAQLFFSANKGVDLSNEQWRSTLLAEAEAIQPLLIVLDPLARIKGGHVDESSQLEIGPVLDYMRELRRVSGACVLFVHHVGHESKDRMRGSSDLEAYWESKISIKETSAGHEIRADHREAESIEPFGFTLTFDESTKTVRMEADEKAEPAVRALIVDYLLEHPVSTLPEIREGVGRRKETCRSELLALEEAGTVMRRETQRPDRNGRQRRADGFYVNLQADSTEVPVSRTLMDLNGTGPTEVPGSHLLKVGPGPGTRLEAVA